MSTATADRGGAFHYSNCYDARGAAACAKQKHACDEPQVRRYCADTCNACSELMVPVQAAWLHGGYLPIWLPGAKTH